MSSSLKTKTLTGVIWSSVQRFGTMIISFVSNIVLARMLSPDDYGCIGILAIFIAVSNTFVDGGFGSALIQKKEPTHEDYSTIFWWNLSLSLVLYFILYLVAPVISVFFSIPLLETVLRVQGVILIVNALNIIQNNKLRKTLNFKRLANINVLSAIISSVIAILLAWQGWGIWSLVVQQLLTSFITTILLWTLNKWIPSFSFSIKSFKQLFNFGSFILASNLIIKISNNIQGVIIGRFFSPDIMGYYAQAQKLETVASQSISGVIEQVVYPVFSQFQNDNVAMKDVMYKVLSSLSYVTVPLMLILILIAEPLFLLFYGEKWLPSVPYFQILCLAGIALSLQNITYYVVASKGESKDLFIWTIIKRIATFSTLIIGFFVGGIWGLLYGVAIGSWIILIVNSYLVSKHIKYKMIDQFMDILPVFILSIVSFLIVGFVGSMLELNIYINALIMVFMYITIYILTSVVLKFKVFVIIMDIIQTFYRKR